MEENFVIVQKEDFEKTPETLLQEMILYRSNAEAMENTIYKANNSFKYLSEMMNLKDAGVTLVLDDEQRQGLSHILELVNNSLSDSIETFRESDVERILKESESEKEEGH